jgi:ATP phosphoribosyltransferase regulatory subunit
VTKYLKQEESILTALTSLYESRGYKKYKPSSFEEYSLYLENRDFLISKNVITFSGIGGKLLALRPDVTLSLVNHCKAEEGITQKLFYNEKVYRQSGDNKEFKEINQTGVEIIGEIDLAAQAEIILLICDTLNVVSDNFILDLSHMGFIEGLFSSFALGGEEKIALYEFLKNKNLHDFDEFAKEKNLSPEQQEAFKGIASIGGQSKKAISDAKKYVLNEQMSSALNELERLSEILVKLGYDKFININFSIANNADYYNGIIFNGYIDGVPRSVLSGGRYDKLLQKLGKNAGAIGFALYLGELERYFKTEHSLVDYLIIYDDRSQLSALEEEEKIIKSGKTVRISRQNVSDIQYGKVIDMTTGGKASD